MDFEQRSADCEQLWAADGGVGMNTDPAWK